MFLNHIRAKNAPNSLKRNILPVFCVCDYCTKNAAKSPFREEKLAKVLITSGRWGDPTIDMNDENQRWVLGACELMMEFARTDRFGVHSVTPDPSAADVIVFVEQGTSGDFDELVRYHSHVKEYREKCFIFESGDYAPPLMPGCYASLRKRHHDPARTRGGYYLRTDRNPYVEFRPLPENPRILGSFIGSISSHPVRTALLHLPSDEFLVEDTSSFALDVMMGKRGDDVRGAFWVHFADCMAEAAFSLCPRGRGPGSIRLFESMRMGRCPVILADDWIAPARVDWRSCSLIVPEKDAARLPQFLRERKTQAAELGLRAHQEWEKYFAPDTCFHWLVEDCLDLKRNRRVPEAVAARLAWRHILEPGYARMFLRTKRNMLRNGGKFLF